MDKYEILLRKVLWDELPIEIYWKRNINQIELGTNFKHKAEVLIIMYLKELYG